MLRTVRHGKPANVGKLFWGCAAGQRDGCGYFEWVDKPAAADSAALARARGPPCACGRPSVELTVSRQGANYGRRFYRCAHGVNALATLGERQCDFFQWADDAPPAAAAAAEPHAAAAAAKAHSGPLCACGAPSAQFRVAKIGANLGRKFYRCAKRECDFFKWGGAQ